MEAENPLPARSAPALATRLCAPPSPPRNLEPATEAEIGTLLVMLAKAGFAYPAGWDAQSVSIYIQALSDMPLDLLQSAVEQWIRSAEDFYPRPGRLRAVVAEELEMRRRAWDREVEDHRERMARLAAPSDAEIAERRRREREALAAEYGFADFAAMAEFGVARAILARLPSPAAQSEEHP